MNVQELTAAVRKGLDKDSGIRINLIADLVRNFGPQTELPVLEQLAEVRGMNVIGIGIGGAEDQCPAAEFTRVFERARELGFHTTAHAGETCGPESIWSAIRDLHVERVGHATSAVYDPALLEHLRATQIGLELCPVSNIRTGAVKSISDHPAREYFDLRLLCTINSDDPAMFNTSLPGEYRLLHEEAGFSHNELRQLILNGIKASWLTTGAKQRLVDEFQADPAWADNR